jgi:hypothetical protein
MRKASANVAEETTKAELVMETTPPGAGNKEAVKIRTDLQEIRNPPTLTASQKLLQS